ncbi:MAG: ATP phosphoribosyltransferase [Saprospiraceae bacterium]|nr:ATP phosphoribosyltransferase [Saprospiraceae bacterium]
MSKLKIALQKSGKLSEKSLQLLLDCGIKFPNGGSKLITEATNFPVEILFLRDDDIPKYVENNIADVGIIGENIFFETQTQIKVIQKLGFSHCRLSLAVPKDVNYPGLSYFQHKKIATSYPNILHRFFEKNGIQANIEIITGSVEIAPGIGLADGICDIVSSGSTLFSNGLKEVEKILSSEAVFVANTQLNQEKNKILEKLLFRIRATIHAKGNKYILLNAPDQALEKIFTILPGMKSPTVLPLAAKGWSSVHSVINEDSFWDIIDALKEAGAEGILVIPIEKMIL